MGSIKKISMIILISFTLFLAACSENSSQNNDTSSISKYSQGVTDSEILIGHVDPQSGPAAAYDLIRKGIDSYFSYINENGGVNGRQLKLIAYDDQYQPAKTVQFTKKLVEEDKVFALVGFGTSAGVAAAQDYLVEKGIPMVMLGAASSEFVNPPIKNFLGSASLNYNIEAKIFLNYAVEKLGAKKIAIAFQNDTFGKNGYDAVKEEISKYPGVEIVEEVPFLATDTEFSSHAQKLKEAEPDAILTFALANPAANLKKAMHKVGVTEPAYIVTGVGANDPNLFNLAGTDVWEGTYSGAVFPMPDVAPDNEHIKLFVEQLGKYYPNDPAAGLAQIGWGEAQVLVEALKRAGDDLTWENLISSLYTFDNWDGSIYEAVTFSENNHYGLTSNFMTQAQDGKILPVTEKITFDPSTGEIQYSN